MKGLTLIFVREAERAAQTLNLLNQQDLDKLNNAIASAEQSMARQFP